MVLNETQKAWALEYISTVAGRGIAEAEPALLELVFRTLSLSEESGGPRDQRGNWDWQYGASNRSGSLYRPWLDEAVHAHLQSAGITPQAGWPEGKPFALCLSHDVDVVTARPTVREAFRYARNTARCEGARASERFMPLRRPWVRRYRTGGHHDVLWHYDRWMKEEARHGFLSSFLMFPDVRCRRHRWDCHYRMEDEVVWDGRRMTAAGMCREIVAAGWDVGLHGSYYSYDDAQVLAEQKRQIEDAAGCEVRSTRQHYLHFEAGSTPSAQSQAGLQVDSSLGFCRNIGFRAGTCFPFRLWDAARGCALPLLEVPLHIMDVAVFDAAALEYGSEDMAVAHALELMDRVAAVQGCLTLNWHPNYLYLPLWWNVYARILEEAARRNAWGCSMEQVRAWHGQRKALAA